VYVNGSYRVGDNLGRLMHDFNCKNSKDFYYPELMKDVRHFKEQGGGRKIMSEVVERYAKEYAEEKRYDDIERILGKGKTPEE
jgi:hypothetical protein